MGRQEWRSQRGAALPEYALVLAAFVVLSIGAIAQLRAGSQAQVENHAHCISFRPPPPDCVVPVVSTTTTIAGPTTTGGPTTTAPPPPDAVASFVDPRSQPTPTSWAALVDIDVEANGTPLAGVFVRVRVRTVAPAFGPWFFLSCTTDASGRCQPSIRFDVPDASATQVVIDVADVTPPDERSLGPEPDPVFVSRP